LLAGVAPFDGIGDYALMTAHLQTPPPPLRGQVPELDVPIEAALMQALAKRPEDRFASVAEFGRAVGAAALRNEAVDILQQLFDRAFRQDAETTRVVTTRSQPEEAEPATQPTPRPVLLDPTPPAFSTPPPFPAIAQAAPLIRAKPRTARWPYAVVSGGAAAALGLAGWFFLLPPGGERALEPPLAQERPQSPAATAGKPGDVAVTSDGSNRSTGERPGAAPPAPPAATAEERPSVPVEPAAPAPPTTVVSPDKPAATETPPAETKTALREPRSEGPTPSSESAPSAVPAKPDVPANAAPPAKPEVTKNEPQPSGTPLDSTMPPASVDKPAPLGPEAPAVAREPEGKPDLQGKVTGVKRLDEIEVGSQWVRLYGIVDRGGAQHVAALLRYLKPARNLVVCYRKALETYRCYADGQDIAQLALRDGNAQLAPNAPPEYHQLVSQRR
jgi:serine/threonine-protein kinase